MYWVQILIGFLLVAPPLMEALFGEDALLRTLDVVGATKIYQLYLLPDLNHWLVIGLIPVQVQESRSIRMPIDPLYYQVGVSLIKSCKKTTCRFPIAFMRKETIVYPDIYRWGNEHFKQRHWNKVRQVVFELMLSESLFHRNLEQSVNGFLSGVINRLQNG